MAIAAFFEFLIFLGLGIFILSRSPRHPVHIAFFLVSTSSALFIGIFSLIYATPEGGDVSQLLRFYHMSIALTGASFVVFSAIFPYDRRRKFGLQALVAYALAAVFAVFTLFSRLDVISASIRNGVLWYDPGPFNSVWFILLIGFLIWMLAQFAVQFALDQTRRHRVQILVSAGGMLIGSLFALFFGLILFNLGLRHYHPWGMLVGGAIVILFLTWSVVSQKWLELKRTLVRTLFWAAMSSLLLSPILFLLKAAAPYWKDFSIGPLFLLAIGIGAIFAVYYTNVQNLLDTILRRNRPSRDRMEEELTAGVLSVGNVEELVDKVKRLFSRHLFASTLEIVVHEKGTIFRDILIEGKKLELAGELTDYLGRKPGALDMELIQGDPDATVRIEEAFRHLSELFQAELVIPLPFDRRLFGLVTLGRKSNGKIYSAEDRKFLRLFQGLFAVALSNSALYGRMENVLDEKTDELRGQNEVLEYAVRSNERSVASLRSLNDLSKLLLSMVFYSAEELFQVLAQAFTGFFGSEKVAVYRQDPRFRGLVLAACNHINGRKCDFPAELPEGDTPPFRAIALRTSAVVYQIGEESEETRQLMQSLTARRSMICIPVLRHEGQGGVICLIDREGDGVWLREELQFLGTVQALAGSSLDKALVLEERIKDERFSTIGQMAASVVHDIRNPIMAIRGVAECLASPEFSEEQHQEFVAAILREAERLSDLASEVLDFSRGELRLDIAENSVPEFVGEVENHLRYLFHPKKVRFTVRTEYGGSARFDPARLRRVLYNIAQNSFDVMNDGDEFLMCVRSEGDRLLFEMTDHGPGIPEAYRDRVFEPFFSAGKAGGTGLGMATSRRIVEEHGGKIRFLSTEEAGTTFSVELPL